PLRGLPSNILPNSRRSISRATSRKSKNPARGSWTSGGSAWAARRQCRTLSPIRACSSRRTSDAVALLEYFPNYIWNLSVAMALESGGKIGEIVDMCQPLLEAARSGDAGTPDFMRQWVARAETLLELAAEDEARGRGFSASDKLERASLYLLVAERMQQQGSAGREETYRKAREAFDRSTSLGALNRERVEIELDNGTMSALFTRGDGEGPRPAVVYCNGL